MIAGLDPSTARIGYADPAGALFSITAQAGPSDRARRLDELDRELERTIRTRPPLPNLVVLEAPTQHGPGALGMIRQAEVRGVLLRRLFVLGIPFAEVTPGSVKRFATGNGAAGKDAMVAAALELGAEVGNDDEADAFHLRRFGRVVYGLEKHLEHHELGAIADAGVTWPTIDVRGVLA